jgi:predicted methyltransferase
MNEKNLYLLLKITNEKGNIKLLINEGLTYPKIAKLTETVINEGYLIYRDDEVKLSTKGVSKMEELKSKFKKINKEEWIKPETKSKVPAINKNDIFLPSQDELSF